MVLLWSSCALTLSVFGRHVLMMNQSGNSECVCLHGGELNESILSWLWLICFSIFLRFVSGFCVGMGAVGIGGGKVGGLLDLHLLGSLCITALDVGSLLRHVAYLLEISSAWYFSGGMEASISRA